MRALRLAVVASMLQVALTACPKTHALVGARATFPAGTQKGVAGTAEVIDDCTIKLTDFTYDGTGPSVWMYGFEKVSDIPGGPGIFLEGPGDATKITRAFNREEYTIDIVGHTLDDFSVLSIWCEEFKIDFGHVVFMAPTSACPKTHALVGARATFPAGTQKGVAGTAEVIDDCTIKLTDFTYDGTGPAVWMYGFKKVSDIPGGPGIFLEGPGDATKITRAFNREEYTIKIVGHTLDDFSVLSIWCVTFRQDFGHVVFSAPTSASTLAPGTTSAPTSAPGTTGKPKVAEGGAYLSPKTWLIASAALLLAML